MNEKAFDVGQQLPGQPEIAFKFSNDHTVAEDPALLLQVTPESLLITPAFPHAAAIRLADVQHFGGVRSEVSVQSAGVTPAEIAGGIDLVPVQSDLQKHVESLAQLPIIKQHKGRYVALFLRVGREAKAEILCCILR